MVERVGRLGLDMVVARSSPVSLSVATRPSRKLEMGLAQRSGGGRVLIDCNVKEVACRYTCGTGCLRRMGRMP